MTQTPMTDPLLLEAAADIFASVCTPADLEAAEADGWAPQAWAAVAEAGLPWISVPESAGGEGGSLTDALAVLRVAGRFGLPVPIAETGVLAGWLLASAGLQAERLPTTVADATGLDWDGTTLTGTVRNVAWGAAASRLVVLAGTSVLVFDPTTLRVERHTGLAGEPSDTVCFEAAAPLAVGTAPVGVDSDTLALRGALTRVVLMSGALEQVLVTTVRYTEERQQFGKPVGRFQAVQQHLVHIGQQTALLDMAAAQASASADSGADADLQRFHVLAAKSVADDAARIATRAAHQAHAAMGMTREYPLHYATRRLWAWTRQWGTGAQVAGALGASVLDAGADAFWPTLTR
jgi:acyl-CoA dehydrogenase